MLSTLAKIGEHLLEGQGVWARLTVPPKFDASNTNWVVPIILKPDEAEMSLGEPQLFKTDEEGEPSWVTYRYINTGLWGPRGKKCCVSCEPKNFKMLAESLFGKGSGSDGSFSQAYDDFYGEPKPSEFRNALALLNEWNEMPADFNESKIKEQLNFGKKDDVAVIFYVQIQTDKIRGGEATALFELDGYEDFIIQKFGKSDTQNGLDYLTGQHSEEVLEPAFSSRYNVNKIFQTTSFNYAAQLNSKSFHKNYQASLGGVAALDKGSAFVLNRWQCRIAGLPHIVVPNYLHSDMENMDVEELTEYLNLSNELLFQTNELESQIQDELPEEKLFWLNYIAYESDGNSFKIINHIKDVNSFHLKNVVEAFKKSGFLFQDWIGGKYSFNLASVYWIIPVRESGKEKKNDALVLFKEILEQRKISEAKIFDFFIRLILCHRFERYRQYQYKRGAGNFDFDIKDAVFKYSALLHTLKQLKLLDMETNPESEGQPENARLSNKEDIAAFFKRMDYSAQEQAMFYLGRVLNTVARAQYNKGHTSKPVLNKINFNGMDASAIERLDLDLNEKARQYNVHHFADSNLAKFRTHFKEEKWTLSPQKNVFYLMAGYTFGLGQSDNKKENPDNNND